MKKPTVELKSGHHFRIVDTKRCTIMYLLFRNFINYVTLKPLLSILNKLIVYLKIA
ncbi:hypothetical protein WSO01_00690 [Weissella soli]|nr:hypothetical protein WSO01_00690 [Weissella soli]